MVGVAFIGTATNAGRGSKASGGSLTNRGLSCGLQAATAHKNNQKIINPTKPFFIALIHTFSFGIEHANSE